MPCPGCGYDLRASAPDSFCPECGFAVGNLPRGYWVEGGRLMIRPHAKLPRRCVFTGADDGLVAQQLVLTRKGVWRVAVALVLVVVLPACAAAFIPVELTMVVVLIVLVPALLLLAGDTGERHVVTYYARQEYLTRQLRRQQNGAVLCVLGPAIALLLWALGLPDVLCIALGFLVLMAGLAWGLSGRSNSLRVKRRGLDWRVRGCGSAFMRACEQPARDETPPTR